MKVESNEERLTLLSVLLKYLGIFMAIIYVVVGFGIVFQSNQLFNIPTAYGLPLGSLLIVYGSFRGYRIYQKHFQR